MKGGVKIGKFKFKKREKQRKGNKEIPEFTFDTIGFDFKFSIISLISNFLQR